MTPTDMKTAVQVTRTISAPVDRVYRAWLDPELARQWLSPTQFTASKVEVEERVGGRHSTWHVDDEGEDVGGIEAEILEFVPNRRISLRWFFVDVDRATDPAFETRVTAWFTPGSAPDTTDLTVVHERIDAAERQQDGLADEIPNGWNQAFDKLVTIV
jgi:uncharacterized protein YndB with AHSA1/START domain